jgi:hypothetical protein
MAGMIGTVAGIGMQLHAMNQQKKQLAQQRVYALQQLKVNKQISKTYAKQANLEFDRRNWEVFRDQQRARSEALATTVNQGASGGGSANQGSALGGAYGQISGQANTALKENSQNFQTYEELQKLYNKLAKIQARQGQAPSPFSMPGFSAFAGQVPRIFSAFGQMGMLGSNQQ